jgi:hypothetical protein
MIESKRKLERVPNKYGSDFFGFFDKDGKKIRFEIIDFNSVGIRIIPDHMVEENETIKNVAIYFGRKRIFEARELELTSRHPDGSCVASLTTKSDLKRRQSSKNF